MNVPEQQDLRTRRAELAMHAPLLLGCVLGLAVGVHSLPFYTAGLFMGPLTQSFGWTRTEISLASTILIAALALVSPFAGAVIDRFGERAVVVPSLVAVVLGFVALSATNGSIALFFATFAIMAIVGAGSATPTFSRIINRTFVRARGTALGIGLVGTGLASSLAPLLIAPVIAGYGWRAGYLCLAAIVGVAIPVIALLTRQGSMAPDIIVDRPIKMTGMVLSKALRDPLLWTLIAIFFLIALAASGLIVHFVPLLIDQGVPAQRAAAVASLIGVALIAARVGTGILLDSFFAPRVAAALMALGAVGLGVLAIGGAPYAVFGAIAIGLTFGAEFDLAGYLCARYFGMRAYGRLYGLCYSSVLAGTALSPLLYGVLRDALGSYTVVLLLSSAALLVSAGLFLTLRPFDAPPAAMPDDNNERKAFVTTILPEEAG